MYFLQAETRKNPDFIQQNINDLCASIQRTIIDILLKKAEKAAKQYGITELALAGGVSANSELRRRFEELGTKNGWATYIPKFEYCTDNAAMIAITAYHKYQQGQFTNQEAEPLARYHI